MKGAKGDETQIEWRLRLALESLKRVASMSESASILRARSIASNALQQDERRQRNCPMHGPMIKARDGTLFCTACSAEDG